MIFTISFFPFDGVIGDWIKKGAFFSLGLAEDVYRNLLSYVLPDFFFSIETPDFKRILEVVVVFVGRSWIFTGVKALTHHARIFDPT